MRILPAAAILTVVFLVVDAAAAPTRSSVRKDSVEFTLELLSTRIHRADRVESSIDFERLNRDFPPRRDGTEYIPKNLAPYTIRKTVRRGEPLWVKLSLKNIGRKPFRVGEEVFLANDFMDALERDRSERTGVAFVIVGPDGKEIPWQSENRLEGCAMDLEGSPVDPRLGAMMDKWKAAGYSDREVERMANAERSRQQAKNQPGSSDNPYPILRPGRTISTKSWVYRGVCKGDRPDPPPAHDDFAELWNYHLDKPGMYSVRVRFKGYAEPHEVSLETPPIKVEVLP